MTRRPKTPRTRRHHVRVWLAGAVGPDGGRYWIITSVMERIGAEIVDSMFDHLSEEDYQAKLAKIRARKAKREQAAKGEP